MQVSVNRASVLKAMSINFEKITQTSNADLKLSIKQLFMTLKASELEKICLPALCLFILSIFLFCISTMLSFCDAGVAGSTVK